MRTHTTLLMMTVLLTVVTMRPATAATDWCQYGDETTLFLVDRTTSYDDRDREVLYKGVSPLFDDLGPGDRLVVQSIAGDWTESERLLEFCHAQCPEPEGVIDWLFSDCAGTRAGKALQRQKAELRGLLKKLLTKDASSPTSDIALTLRESVKRLQTSARRGDIPPLRHVAIFSDLLENTDYLPASELKELPPEKALARWREHETVPDFANGVAVDVWGFGRKHKQGREPLPAKARARIKESWQRLFEAAGAGSVTIQYRR